MISFLISIDKFGIITDINWSSPTHLIMMRNNSILDLFHDTEKDIVKDLILKSIRDIKLTKSPILLHLNGQIEIEMILCPIDSHVLVFAIETFEMTEIERDKFFEIIYKFVATIQTYFKSNEVHNNESAIILFEKIQGLNNDLVNTKRALEKTNAQLNRLNQDLNNRLVKDALTGLVSRYQYRTEMDFVISNNPGKLGIFAFIDIDEFKAINDSYGHMAGDAFLVEFANRLKKLPGDNIIKLRIAGDEFGIFAYGYENLNLNVMNELWEKIQEYILTEPIEIEGTNLQVSISVGMSAYGIDTHEIYEIIEYADFAMYQAKLSGKNCFRCFDKNDYKLRENSKYSKEH